MGDTPIYDRLIAERRGRGPAEFEGHDRWEESWEARQAYARGVAEAEATAAEFWDEERPAPRRRSGDRVTPPGDTPPRDTAPRDTPPSTHAEWEPVRT
ncbi:MAG TPA: hypothetical protein VE287_07495 [Actinopolymorphaceae bacterium]|nr:hypothetical protein [Actinopolymorphaceae bacterium]